MAVLVESGIPLFTDLDGSPLSNGYIYVGEPGLNPITNPQQAYWDEDLTKLATNIRTVNGYPSAGGRAARLYVEGTYSLLVQNQRGETVYSLLTSLGGTDKGFSTPDISEYNSSTTYVSQGEDVVTYGGVVYVNTSALPNVGNSPLSNPDIWYQVPSPDELNYLYTTGKYSEDGLRDVSDRDESGYLQNMSLGTYLFDTGETMQFYLVRLDGSLITGDTTLESILDIGEADQYIYLDHYTTGDINLRLIDLGESLGTRYIVIRKEL